MGYSSCRVVLQCLKYNQSFKTVNKISNSEKDAWFWRLNCKYQNKEVWIELRTLIANNRIWWYSSSNINSPFKTVIILDWKIVILTTIMRPRYEFYQILNSQNCQKFLDIFNGRLQKLLYKSYGLLFKNQILSILQSQFWPKMNFAF